MSAVIIEDSAFRTMERGISGVREDLIALVSGGKAFEEFHAYHLYRGHGAFEGIDQTKRFELISRILWLLDFLKISVIYGAVNVPELKRQPYASANPRDMAFRSCLDGIEHWFKGRRLDKASTVAADARDDFDEKVGLSLITSYLTDLVILIVDDGDKLVREMLQTTYRSRDRGAPFHDDMYFGDSRYSVGIQLADLCAYFIALHLEGNLEIQGFYESISPHIVYAQVHPNDPKVFDPVLVETETSDET